MKGLKYIALLSFLVIGATANAQVVKDHVTDPSCWNTNSKVSFHQDSPMTPDAISAASFVGKGGYLKTIGGIFVDSSCGDNGFNEGHFENMEVSLMFYENVDVFMNDPYLQNQSADSKSKKVVLPMMHTSPQDPHYVMNPMAVSPSGTNMYYVEVDAYSARIKTTQNATHLAALWFKGATPEDGTTWMVLSNGCAGQVGDSPDYYATNIMSPALADPAEPAEIDLEGGGQVTLMSQSMPRVGTLETRGAAYGNAAYRITETKVPPAPVKKEALIELPQGAVN